MAVLQTLLWVSLLLCCIHTSATDDETQKQVDEVVISTPVASNVEQQPLSIGHTSTISLGAAELSLESDSAVEEPADEAAPVVQEGKPDAELTFEEWKSLEMDDVVEQRNIPKLSDLPKLINYAANECGAQVLETSGDVKSAGAVLKGAKDNYLIAPCSSNFSIVIELCDNILIQELRLANYEMFSSMIKQLEIHANDAHNNRNEWDLIATLDISDNRKLQNFSLTDVNTFARYVKLQAVGHYGSEFYCPLNIVQIYGITMLEEFQFIRAEAVAPEGPVSPEDSSISSEEPTVLAKDVQMEIPEAGGDADSEPTADGMGGKISNLVTSVVSLFRTVPAKREGMPPSDRCPSDNTNHNGNVCLPWHAVLQPSPPPSVVPLSPPPPPVQEYETADETPTPVPSLVLSTARLATQAIQALQSSSTSKKAPLPLTTPVLVTSLILAATPTPTPAPAPTPAPTVPAPSSLASMTTMSELPSPTAAHATADATVSSGASLLPSLSTPLMGVPTTTPLKAAPSSKLSTAMMATSLPPVGKIVKGSALAELRSMILNVEKNLSLTNKYLDKLSHRTLTLDKALVGNFTQFFNETRMVVEALLLVHSAIELQGRHIAATNEATETILGSRQMWTVLLYSTPAFFLMLIQTILMYRFQQQQTRAFQALSATLSPASAGDITLNATVPSTYRRFEGQALTSTPASQKLVAEGDGGKVPMTPYAHFD